MGNLIFLLSFLLPSFALADEVNLLKNSGFEAKKISWVKTGSSTLTIESASPLDGSYSGIWDASATGEFFRSNLYTVTAGLKGSKCSIELKYLWDTGTEGHILMNVDDGTNNIATVTLNSTSGGLSKKASTTFECPSSGSIRFELESTANATAITMDAVFIGSGRNLLMSLPQDMFSAKVSSADAVSDENLDWINGDCTNATAGTATCVFKTGIFTTTPNCQVVSNSVTSSGTSPFQCEVSGGSTSSTQVQILCKQASSSSDQPFTLSCQKVESAANREMVTLETSGSSWSGYHDSTCSWARTNTAYGDPTADASCALVERTNSGFGTVTTAGAALPGIIFTPKQIGKYFVCAAGNLLNAGGANVASRLWDGTTVIAETNSFFTSSSNGSALSMCGIYNISSVSSLTLSIQTKSSSGSVTLTPGGAGSTVEWSIFPITQQFPAPVFTELQNLVKSNVADVKTNYALLNCDASSAITSQIGTWISSIGNISAGACTITLNSGIFTTTPYCFVTRNASTADNLGHHYNVNATSTTNVTIDGMNSADTALGSYDFYFQCVGQ